MMRVCSSKCLGMLSDSIVPFLKCRLSQSLSIYLALNLADQADTYILLMFICR